MKFCFVFSKKQLLCFFCFFLFLSAFFIFKIGVAGKNSINYDEKAERINYFENNGIAVDINSEAESEVQIPLNFSKVFENYNEETEKQGGFDLKPYSGKTVKKYEYNLCDKEGYTAVLYVFDGKIIGGDIHSLSLDGKMLPLTKGEEI